MVAMGTTSSFNNGWDYPKWIRLGVGMDVGWWLGYLSDQMASPNSERVKMPKRGVNWAN